MYQQASPINRKILLIDDDCDVHNQFRSILDSIAEPEIRILNASSDTSAEKQNPAQFQQVFQLDSACNGNEGYQRIIEEEIAGSPYALAFINDKLTPELDGIETIRKIWGDAPDLEIVLCLNNTDYSYGHIIDALGTSEQLFIVRKPLDPLEVKQLAEALTRKWSFKHATRQSMHAVRDEYVCRVRELEGANKALQAELIASRREKASLSEEFYWYQVMFDNAGDSVMVHFLDSRGGPGRFVNVNACACDRFGYSRDEFLEMCPSDIIKPLKADSANSIYKRLQKRGEIECECLGVTREGKETPITLMCRRFEHQGKQMVMVVARDVFRRVQLGAAFAAAEDIDTYVRNADDVVYTMSNDMVFTSISSSFESITGWTREEWIGKSSAPMIHPDDLEIMQDRFKMVLDGQWAPMLEVRVCLKSGKYISVEVISTPHIHNGKVIGLLGIARDITERKRAEEEVESLAKFPAENPNPVMRIDQNGILLYANNAADKILKSFGFESGKSVLPEWGDYVARVRNEDGPVEVEITCQSKIYSLLFTPIRGAGYLNVYGIDVTEHRRAEAQRLEMKKQLVHAERMESLAVLAGGVAHDLNNVLGPLVGYPDLILKKLPPDHPAVRIVGILGKSARDAADIIQDLLTLARRGRLEFSPVNLNDVVQDFIDSATFLQLTANHPDVNVKINLDSEPAGLAGSAHHLSKVIMNLIINAVDAMPEGGTLTVETSHDYLERLPGGYADIVPGEYTMVSVRDTGIGISKGDRRKIFEPYYSKKNMGASGSGLGLAIVYGIVRDHNGYYDVLSEPGKGTDFVLYFPVMEVPDRPDVTMVDDIGGTERILIIDDNPDQRALAGHLLGNLGYPIYEAADGSEALEILRREVFDLIVLDMVFEDGPDGLDIYRSIRDLIPDQKAIIVSGHTADDRVRETQALGAGAFVRKPFTQQTLGRAVRAELNLSNAAIANQPATAE